MPTTIYTIGHSTHTLDDFIRILQAYQIQVLVDVRSYARSWHNPQFNEDTFAQSLLDHGIHYHHLKGLGGRRRTTPDSVNTAWKNTSFRGFADYMQTADFSSSLDELLEIANGMNTAIMCAEAVPWRCHRSLIGDALLARGIEVMDIFDEKTSKPHHLTPWARVTGSHVIYPGDEI